MSKFNFHIIYRSRKQSIKLNSLIRKIKNFSKNDDDNRTQYRYRIIFKNNNLNKKIKNVAQLVSMLFDEIKENMIYLVTIIYDFNEQNNFNDEKSSVESSLRRLLIKAFREKSSVKSTKVFVVEALDLLRQIKSVYEYDDVI